MRKLGCRELRILEKKVQHPKRTTSEALCQGTTLQAAEKLGLSQEPQGFVSVVHRLRRPAGNETVPHPSDVLVFVRWVGVDGTPMTTPCFVELQTCFLLGHNLTDCGKTWFCRRNLRPLYQCTAFQTAEKLGFIVETSGLCIRARL
jgi:hypothetical protein